MPSPLSCRDGDGGFPNGRRASQQQDRQRRGGSEQRTAAHGRPAQDRLPRDDADPPLRARRPALRHGADRTSLFMFVISVMLYALIDVVVFSF